MSLLMLFSAFTGSRLDTLLGEDNSSSKGSRESSADGLPSSTTAYDSDGETLVGDGSESKARTTRPGTTATETSSFSSYGILTLWSEIF